MELLFLREDTPPTVEGRTLVARVCTYGRPYTVAKKRERIRAGAFKSPLARPGGLLRYRHVGERQGDTDDPSLVYGTVRVLREDAGTLIAEADVIEGPRGDQLLALASSGAITGISMSALVAESHMTRDDAGPLQEITRISQFYGISLTPSPAYPEAGVLTVREVEHAVDVEKLQRARAETARIRAQLTADMARWGKPGKMTPPV